LVDPRSGAALCEIYPLDRAKNATGRRRALEPVAGAAEPAATPTGIAPLLRELMAQDAATGLPPAYVPLAGAPDDDDTEEDAS
jgi:hypothetical protein